jgi:molybdopterin synthase catalytic subunit
MIPLVKIQSADFDIALEIAGLHDRSGDVGAVATFTGYVRADGDLTALTLEYYPAMTKLEIARHVAEAWRKWPLLGVTVIHRVGRLMTGDRIVFVAVAASHRRTAFEACEFLIDYLKVQAPFWKQEERGGTSIWVEAKGEDDEAAKRWRT